MTFEVTLNSIIVIVVFLLGTFWLYNERSRLLDENQRLKRIIDNKDTNLTTQDVEQFKPTKKKRTYDPVDVNPPD